MDAMIPGAAGAVRGGREVLLNAVRAPFSASEDFEPMKAYSRGQAFQEARQKAASEAHPTAANVAAGAGIVGGLTLPATKIAKGATLFQKAKAGMKTAGAYGALSGAMSSKDETLLGRAADTISSGVTSAAVGLGLPYALNVAGKVAAPIVRPIARPVTGMIGRGLEGLSDHVPGNLGNWIAAEGRQLARDPVQAAANAQLGREIGAISHPQTGRPLRAPQVAEEVQRRQALGVPAVAADTEDTLRRRFASAVRAPGPATSRVRQLVDERKQQEAARTVDHIAASLGPVGNVERQAEQLSAQARAAAAPLYEISNAQPIPVAQELQELFSRPAGKQAMQRATTALENEGIAPFAKGLIERPGGVWEVGQVPTMQTYDYAKTALDDAVFGGQSPFATVDATRDMRGSVAIRSRLLDLMDGDGSGPRFNPPATHEAANVPTSIGTDMLAGHALMPLGMGNSLPIRLDTPGPWTGQRLHGEAEEAAGNAWRSSVPPEGLNPYWKPAREAYAGPVQNRKALELGEEMARADATDAASRMEGMTGSQLDHFRLGHRSGLAENVQKTPDYGDAANRLAGATGKRAAIETVHGPEAAGALYGRLEPEQEANRTYRAIRGGSSDRAPNANEQDRAIEEGAKGILQAITGHPGAGVRGVLSALARGEEGGAAVNNRIAEILGEPDPKTLAEAMRAISREKARRASVSQNAGKAAQKASRFVGALAGTNLIEPADDEPLY
ncbi:hypothetical protein EWH08_11110 [Sphingobium indicum]|uniref:Uncharacterized protein n=1 Tax=Sphingobium indicum TaxID=332055 RepID=A0A4Q4J858_9SPHN|nr:hypothetical protein [Sphingobium indicum]NYI23072.1 hypothetical protein [Sphingobium indicum]RYM01850.1 hypothetical protein EWH08_11110 [Sphingobium indicum]